MLNTQIEMWMIYGLLGCLLVCGIMILFFIRRYTVLKARLIQKDQEVAVGIERLKRTDHLIEENEALRARAKLLEEQVLTFEKQSIEQQVSFQKDREHFEASLTRFRQMEEQFKETFKSLSADVLKANNSAFLELANENFRRLKEGAKSDLTEKEQSISSMLQPIKDGLKQFDDRMIEIEKGRSSQMSSVAELIQSLSEANQQTRLETRNLAAALKAPNIRGQWGELQLKRTIEIAGMLNYCDFVEQKQIGGDDVQLRPDVVIRLPNQREIVIDSKVPLSAYLDANETDDLQLKVQKMELHAKQLREHLKKLGQKAYHEHLKHSPEFVVLFLPGESIYSSALERDPQLIEYGVNQKVLIATPTTLIALLKAIAYGWKNHEMVERTDDIHRVGKEVYESVLKMLEHFSQLRRSLNQTVQSFNQTVRSADKRLLPRIRKFRDLGIGADKSIAEIPLIEEEVDSSPLDSNPFEEPNKNG